MEKICNLCTPSDVRYVRSVISLCHFIWTLVRSFAIIAMHLTGRTRMGDPSQFGNLTNYESLSLSTLQTISCLHPPLHFLAKTKDIWFTQTLVINKLDACYYNYNLKDVTNPLAIVHALKRSWNVPRILHAANTQLSYVLHYCQYCI